MSGGHFNYSQWLFDEIAQTIAADIARALKPKPAKIHENYWTIEVMECPGSYYTMGQSGWMEFGSYEEAEKYLFRRRDVVEAEPKYKNGRFFRNEDDVIFQSTQDFMSRVPDGEKIPVLYAIHHAEYDTYPRDAEVLELTDETIETMKEAYRQIRKARIYADRVDWMMSGDDGEDDLQERLKEELDAFEKEFQSKDWTENDDE